MPKPRTDPTGIAGTSKLKAPARMLIPLSDRAEQLIRKTATATGRTLSSVQVEVSTRTLEGKLLMDGLVEKVCRDLIADHAKAMQALFGEEPS
jgi:hypothetical protein